MKPMNPAIKPTEPAMSPMNKPKTPYKGEGMQDAEEAGYNPMLKVTAGHTGEATCEGDMGGAYCPPM